MPLYEVASGPGMRSAEGELWCIAVLTTLLVKARLEGSRLRMREVMAKVHAKAASEAESLIEMVTCYGSGRLSRWTAEESVTDPKERIFKIGYQPSSLS